MKMSRLLNMKMSRVLRWLLFTLLINPGEKRMKSVWYLYTEREKNLKWKRLTFREKFRIWKIFLFAKGIPNPNIDD